MVSSAEDGDEVANKILHDSVQELADTVIAVVRRLRLCGEGNVYVVRATVLSFNFVQQVYLIIRMD